MTLAHLDALDALDAPSSTLVAPSRADTDSWTNVVASVARLAQEVAGTSFVPKTLRNDVPATTAAILYGREVGLPPMTALTQIHVVEGRPGMSAEGMRALVFAAGHELVFEESTGAVCRMRARRRGSSTWTPLAWTLDMARAAGLNGKDNWRKYPRAMLAARCTTDLCRMMFPDVIHGFRSIEELADMADDTGAEPARSSSSTTVQRGRKTAKRPAALPERAPAPTTETPDPPSSPDRPPLPGEEGPADVPAAGPESRPPAVGTPPAPRSPNPAPTTPPPPEEPDAGPRMVNRPTLRAMFREFGRVGVRDSDRDGRLSLLADMVNRPVGSSNDLTQEEATRVLTMLTSAKDVPNLRILIATTAVEDLPEPLPEPDDDDDQEEPKP